MAALQHNHTTAGPITAAMLREWRESCPLCAARNADRGELIDAAMAIYIERLGQNPFYAKWGNDRERWVKYIGSRPVEARTLVNRSRGLPDDYLPECWNGSGWVF